MSINAVYAKIQNMETGIEETKDSNKLMLDKLDKLEKLSEVLFLKHSLSNLESEAPPCLYSESNLEPLTKQLTALEISVEELSANAIVNVNNKLSELEKSVSELSTNVSTFSILPAVVNKTNAIEQAVSDLYSKQSVVENTSKEVQSLSDKIEALEKKVEELSSIISKMD
jgi:methyl-accepting chemotaxis protein